MNAAPSVPTPVMTPPGGRVVLQPMRLTDLVAAPYNPRTISPEALGGLGQSIARFGVVQPVVWNRRTGHVVGGHQRLKALAAQGVQETDVVVVDLPEVEEKALNLSLNSSAISGEFTADALALIDEVAAALPDMASALLFSDLRDSVEDMFPPPVTPLDDDAAPEPPENPISKPGDLWILGEHRILCGDSTKPDDVARLMDGKQASLLATDPPYLVDYKGGNHPQSHANRPEVREKHWDDYVDPETGIAFFRDYLVAALAHCEEGIAVYQWCASKRWALVEAAWEAAGLLAHQQLIWVKDRPVLGRCSFMYQHEPCLFGWVKTKMPRRKPPSNTPTVWHISQKGEQDGIHPTQKPLEVFAQPIRWHTKEGEICLEPFSGSGTQIIAAERLGRRCFAMELSPAFVDVAVTRWERLSGKKAERVAS